MTAVPALAGCYKLTWASTISGGGQGVGESTSRHCIKAIDNKFRATFYEGTEVVHILNTLTGPTQEFTFWQFGGSPFGLSWAPQGIPAIGISTPAWSVGGSSGATY